MGKTRICTKPTKTRATTILFAADKTNTGRSTHFDDAVPMLSMIGAFDTPRTLSTVDVTRWGTATVIANRHDLKYT